MPLNRVFGRIEKGIRRQDIIRSPENYYSVFERYVCVRHVPVSWNQFDYKALAAANLKSTVAMKIQSNRVWIFKHKFEDVFTCDTYSSIPRHFSPLKIQSQLLVTKKLTVHLLRSYITDAKQPDVQHLLTFLT